MFSKLMKYEWKATWKPIAFMNLALLVLTAVGCLTFIFNVWETESPVVIIGGTSLLLVYYLSLFGISIASIILLAIRFYKSCYSDEGYLTHTLPVRTTSILFSKIIIGSLIIFITSFIALLSVGLLLVSLISTLDGVTMQAFMFTFKTEVVPIIEEVMQMKMSSLGILMVFLLFLSSISGTLMYVGAISLGQLFKTHKVLGSFVSYFGIYFFMQIISSIIILPLTIGTAVSAPTAGSSDVEALIGMQTISISLWFSLGLSIFISVVLFFISNYIMKKKLNLE